jgi:uncharacterized protein YbjQ (UPF0145 family)
MISLALFGCAASELEAHQQARYVAGSPDPAARVLISDAAALGAPTEVLGIVDAHMRPGHQDEALAELRARAAALGADAVTGVEFHHGEAAGQAVHLSGVAVRYRDLLQGRSYDVIADLDARAPMGEEERAHGDLRRQAGAVHADLILDVRFHHGEASDGSVRLTGKAIRFRVP